MNKGFTYEQRTGTFYVSNGSYDCPLGVGYAGRGDYRNDPAAEAIKNLGPLPAGRYSLYRAAHKRFASPAIRLDPRPDQEMYGRSGFWIHGDNLANDASSGCIILDHATRSAIAALMAIGFAELEVVP